MTDSRRDVARQIMNPPRLPLWLFRLSIVSFALAWMLPVFPSQEGFFFPGAMAFLAAPFVAFGVCVNFLFDDFGFENLFWAVVLTVASTMNGVFLVAPFLREAFAERPVLISVSAGISAVAATIICHVPFQIDTLLPVWSPVGLAWIVSFVLMSASGVASCFASVSQSSTSQSLNHDD